jgi:hypothetical protein
MVQSFSHGVEFIDENGAGVRLKKPTLLRQNRPRSRELRASRTSLLASSESGPRRRVRRRNLNVLPLTALPGLRRGDNLTGIYLYIGGLGGRRYRPESPRAVAMASGPREAFAAFVKDQ